MNRWMAVACGVMAWVACACAYDFSADVVTKAGGRTERGKVFVSGEKMRMEMKEAVTITRGDRKVVWVLMPEEKMYMEMPFQPGSVPMEEPAGRIEKVLVGKEVVGGKPATKYKVTYVSGSEKSTVYQWFLDADNFPVKTEALDGSWSHEYQNISRTKPASDLFEIPSGYTKFSMPAMPRR